MRKPEALALACFLFRTCIEGPTTRYIHPSAADMPVLFSYLQSLNS